MRAAALVVALLGVLAATPTRADWPAEKAQLVGAAEREGELVGEVRKEATR